MSGVLRTSMTTRQGRKVPRMLYLQKGAEPADDDPIVGLVDTPELAEAIAYCVNAMPPGSASLLDAAVVSLTAR